MLNIFKKFITFRNNESRHLNGASLVVYIYLFIYVCKYLKTPCDNSVVFNSHSTFLFTVENVNRIIVIPVINYEISIHMPRIRVGYNITVYIVVILFIINFTSIYLNKFRDPYYIYLYVYATCTLYIYIYICVLYTCM